MYKNKRFQGGLSTLFLAASLVITAPASAQSTVVMQKQDTSFAIDGDKGAIQGNQVYLWNTRTSNVNQQWVESAQGSRHVSYQKNNTSLCMDGGDGGARLQPVTLETCDSSNRNQHWEKISLSNGSFRLEKRGTSFSIDGNKNAEREQAVYLWNSRDSNVNQQWEFFTGGTNPPPVAPPPPPVTPPTGTPPTGGDDDVETNTEAANFLLQATFGPTESSIRELRNLGYSAWFRRQISYEVDDYLTETLAQERRGGDPVSVLNDRYSLNTWFEKATTADDQLRQVAAFALSQIFVTSTEPFRRKAGRHAAYKDVIQNNALGNYRELLQDVTYSPMMGAWLTYAGNEKADPRTGSEPDENYAREIMQLFTFGLVELQQNGTPRTIGGQEIEIYDGNGVAELAKVFTGLYFANVEFGERISKTSTHQHDLDPMVMTNEFHSEGPKTILGQRIPGYSNGNRTISDALDILFAHDTVAPFISKQLIQRLVTSNPSESYIERVSNAFSSGTYRLPDGGRVGSGERGDLIPVWAAILFAPEARGDYRFENTVRGNSFGKLRDPIERFVHWMRVSDVTGFEVERIAGFGRGDFPFFPFRAQSVFNFYRPGYTKSNSNTGDAGLVAPELQVFNGPTMIPFLNAMRRFIIDDIGSADNFMPAYTRELRLADDADALVDHLDLVYTANQMSDETKRDMIQAIEEIDVSGNRSQMDRAKRQRVNVATLLTFASVEFTVRR